MCFFLGFLANSRSLTRKQRGFGMPSAPFSAACEVVLLPRTIYEECFMRTVYEEGLIKDSYGGWRDRGETSSPPQGLVLAEGGGWVDAAGAMGW